MDQLELLKKDWKNKEVSLPKLSKEELSRLILKRSSSIVKWIFIISVLEFLLPHTIYLFIDYDEVTKNTNTTYLLISSIITYSVAIYFMVLFYKNYSSINASKNTKALMKNIIKTRKTVKMYIWFNLAMFFIMGLFSIYFELNSEKYSALGTDISIPLIYFISVVFLIVLIGVLWLFYQLIYGILLKRLHGNYKELTKAEL